MFGIVEYFCMIYPQKVRHKDTSASLNIYVCSISELGNFWFEESLRAYLIEQIPPHTQSCNHRFITDVPSQEWPQFYVTKHSVSTTPSSASVVNDIFKGMVAALEQYTSNTLDDTGRTQVEWTLNVEKKILTGKEVKSHIGTLPFH